MSTDDVPDWTNPITEVSGGSLTDDFPDWTQAVVDTGGGGGTSYASLTGAGETVTPGALTQVGGFNVTDTAAPIGGIFLHTAHTAALDGAIAEVLATTEISIACSSATPPSISIQDSGGGGITLQSSGPINSAASGTMSITANQGMSFIVGSAFGIHFGTSFATHLDFYGHSGAGAGQTQQTVTGSRGGNAALASLLTALNNLGLIVDGSTP